MLSQDPALLHILHQFPNCFQEQPSLSPTGIAPHSLSNFQCSHVHWKEMKRRNWKLKKIVQSPIPEFISEMPSFNWHSGALGQSKILEQERNGKSMSSLNSFAEQVFPNNFLISITVCKWLIEAYRTAHIESEWSLRPGFLLWKRKQKQEAISCVLWKMEKANVKGSLGHPHLLVRLVCVTSAFSVSNSPLSL